MPIRIAAWPLGIIQSCTTLHVAKNNMRCCDCREHRGQVKLLSCCVIGVFWSETAGLFWTSGVLPLSRVFKLLNTLGSKVIWHGRTWGFISVQTDPLSPKDYLHLPSFRSTCTSLFWLLKLFKVQTLESCRQGPQHRAHQLSAKRNVMIVKLEITRKEVLFWRWVAKRLVCRLKPQIAPHIASLYHLI